MRIVFSCLSMVAICAPAFGQVDGRPNYSTQVRTANEAHTAELNRIAQEMGVKYVDAVNTLQSLSTYARSISNALQNDYGQQQFSSLVTRFGNMVLDPTLSQQISSATNKVRADIGKQVTKTEGDAPGSISSALLATTFLGQRSAFSDAFAQAEPLRAVTFPDWEELKRQFLEQMQAEIDRLESMDAEAIQTVLDIQAAAVQGKQTLESMGFKDTNSQWRYLHRMDLRPSQTDQFLERLKRDLGTDWSK